MRPRQDTHAELLTQLLDGMQVVHPVRVCFEASVGLARVNISMSVR